MGEGVEEGRQRQSRCLLFTLLSSLLNVARLGFEHGLVWLETDVEGEMESTRPCPNKIMCLKHFNLQMVVVFQNKTGPLI